MKMTSCAGCIIILFLLPTVAAADDTATVHGVAYDWSTLAPLDNVIIEVNSTPAQYMVAKYGMYSLELPEGSYCITASYYVNGDLICCDEEEITITDEGNYVVDLLLVPSYTDNSTDNSLEETASYTPVLSSSNLLIVSGVIVLILLASLFFKVRSPEKTCITKNMQAYISTVHSSGEHKTAPAVVSENKSQFKITPQHQLLVDLSSEHLEILNIIRSAGGTMSQKELRKHLSYSEGKACVMIVELERKGLIKKVKKGRGNILFLTDMEV